MSISNSSEQKEKFENATHWLNEQGFQQHPFEILTADNDENIGINSPDGYFQQFPYFDRIAAPGETSFLFLRRGDGKSANKRMLEKLCNATLNRSSDDDYQQAPDNDVPKEPDRQLAVSHTDFHELIAEDNVTLREHVDAILGQAVPLLLQYLLDTDEGNKLVAANKENNEELLYDFAWFVTKYSRRLSPRSIKWQLDTLSKDEKAKTNLLKNILAKPVTKAAGKIISSAVPGGELLEFLVEPVLGLLDSNPESGNEIPEITHSALVLMARFAEIAQAAGIKDIFILIDRVDEYAHIYDYKRAVAMLHPLISAIPLLEMPAYSFKFFLPREMKPELKAYIRTDRFAIYEYQWQPYDLKKLFRNRLAAYALKPQDKKQTETPNVPALPVSTSENNSVEDFQERGEQSDFTRLLDFPINEDELLTEMIRYSGNSPRGLLKLGKQILDEHTRPDEFSSKISFQTYKKALAKFANEQLEQIAVSTPSIRQIRKLRLLRRKTLADMIGQKTGLDPVQAAKDWEREGLLTAHFTLYDIIEYLNQPKQEAFETARRWEKDGLVSILFNIKNEQFWLYLKQS